jgi:hypothetical protein
MSEIKTSKPIELADFEALRKLYRERHGVDNETKDLVPIDFAKRYRSLGYEGKNLSTPIGFNELMEAR